MTSYTFSIDFPRWKVIPYDSFRSKVVLLAKRNMLRDLRDQSERFKWSREQAQNLSLHIFFHNYHNYSMFRDVPECSGMFHVPCFIDGLFNCQQILKQRFLSLSLILWYKTNRMWLSVVCIDNDLFIYSCVSTKAKF